MFFQFVVALIIVSAVFAVQKFPLKKKDNHEFVQGLLERARKGIK